MTSSLTLMGLAMMGPLMAQPLCPNALMTLPIPCGGLLRLAVKGDPIQDVVIYPDKLASRLTLHKSGQLFLDTKGLAQSLNLTLITQHHVTQDMRLTCDPTCAVGPLIFEPEEHERSPTTSRGDPS